VLVVAHAAIEHAVAGGLLPEDADADVVMRVLEAEREVGWHARDFVSWSS